jgi:hypothetical protein
MPSNLSYFRGMCPPGSFLRHLLRLVLMFPMVMLVLVSVPPSSFPMPRMPSPKHAYEQHHRTFGIAGVNAAARLVNFTNGPTVADAVYDPFYRRLVAVDILQRKVLFASIPLPAASTSYTFFVAAGTGFMGKMDNVVGLSANFDNPIGIARVFGNMSRVGSALNPMKASYSNGATFAYIVGEVGGGVRQVLAVAPYSVSTILGFGLAYNNGNRAVAGFGNLFMVRVDETNGLGVMAENGGCCVRGLEWYTNQLYATTIAGTCGTCIEDATVASGKTDVIQFKSVFATLIVPQTPVGSGRSVVFITDYSREYFSATPHVYRTTISMSYPRPATEVYAITGFADAHFFGAMTWVPAPKTVVAASSGGVAGTLIITYKQTVNSTVTGALVASNIENASDIATANDFSRFCSFSVPAGAYEVYDGNAIYDGEAAHGLGGPTVLLPTRQMFRSYFTTAQPASVITSTPGTTDCTIPTDILYSHTATGTRPKSSSASLHLTRSRSPSAATPTATGTVLRSASWAMLTPTWTRSLSLSAVFTRSQSVGRTRTRSFMRPLRPRPRHRRRHTAR